MKRDYTPGSTVFVVERDDFDEPIDITGYMFLASVKDYALLSVFVGDSVDLDETLEYHAEQTVARMVTDLVAVFPLKDCYSDCEQAYAARRKELMGSCNTSPALRATSPQGGVLEK